VSLRLVDDIEKYINNTKFAYLHQYCAHKMLFEYRFFNYATILFVFYAFFFVLFQSNFQTYINVNYAHWYAFVSVVDSIR
jgi:hypothetical protein